MNAALIRENNSRLLSLLSVYLNCFADTIDASDVREIAHSCHVTVEYAYAQLLGAVLGLDTAGADKMFFKEWLLPCVRRLDPDGFRGDEYYRTVDFPDVKLGEWELTHGAYAPCEAFVCGDLRRFPNGKILPQIGFFEEPFSYPQVKQGGVEWMSVIPNEIVTMESGVCRARGRVLTFGLGLGYFAFHASLKDEVESVTVVERDENVIKLFSEHILPSFPHPHKVRVICADAFDYAKGEMGSAGYDYIYTDIWHDPSDGVELYLKMKEHECYAPAARFDYWCEDTIRCYL